MTHTKTGRALYQKVFYFVGRNLFRLAFKLFWRLEIEGLENVPLTGGVILASNHVSLADPPLVGAAVQRPLHFFAKEELFRYPIFGWLIRQVNAFPVKRYEHDVGAFKRALQLLKSGEAVLLFPQGGRKKSGNIKKAKPGVGMLSYKTQVPVVPVCLIHSDQLKCFKKLRVIFGKPFFPVPSKNERENYQEFSDTVLNSIENLSSKM